MKKGIKIIIIILSILLLLTGTLFVFSRNIDKDANPHILAVTKKQKESIESIKQIDEDGHLYYMEYTADYNAGIPALFRKIAPIASKSSCTSFVTSDIDTKDVINARNFDTAHLGDDGKTETMALIIKLKPENAYASLNMFDVLYYWEINVKYHPGYLNNGKFDNSLLLLAPLICMDGINEKGVSVSIMTVDIKEGETPTRQNEKGKTKTMATLLLRDILDHCANCDEAIKLAQESNVFNLLGSDFHLLVCDESGRSIVLEWRYDKLNVIETDCSTNFFLGSDDAEDCYYDEGTYLKEAFPGKADVSYPYHWGYGHGYERFNTVVSKLDKAQVNNYKTRTALKYEEIVQLLQDVKQIYKSGHDSDTQYSVIYNNTAKSLRVYPNKEYNKYYEYTIK